MGRDSSTRGDLVECRELANYRIDFVTTRPDAAFACKEHLGQMVSEVLSNCRGGAARVIVLPGTSEEPCELGVE